MNDEVGDGRFPDQADSVGSPVITPWTGATPNSEISDQLVSNRAPKRDGAFTKFGAAVKKVATDRLDARAELERKHAEDARTAGPLVTSGTFGFSTIEIYERGYVRIAVGLDNATQPATITKSTPYEKLRSIKFTDPTREQASSSSAGLEKALGPALSSLMKGGKVFMKSSAPGLAVAGIQHIATNAARKSFLTIVTDKEIHTIINHQRSIFGNGTKGPNEVGLVLESAGMSVLETVAEPASTSSPEPQPHLAALPVREPTLAERLRELAGLHSDGILSDDEFAAAKAKLLGGL